MKKPLFYVSISQGNTEAASLILYIEDYD